VSEDATERGTSRRLRLLIAGAGVIGRAHAQRIFASESCVLAGIADPSSAAADYAAGLGVPHWTELGAALAAARPDGVILATPNTLHVQGALLCIERGVAVLVEKPVADSLAEAVRLVEAVERGGVPVLVGHHRRHSVAMAVACEAIESGALGSLVAVQGSAQFHKPSRYFDEAPWRRKKGSGPILNNMVHEVDNLRMLAGEIDAVQAMTSNARRGHEVEDTASIALRFASGALGSFMLSDTAASTRSWEQTSGENAAYAHDATEACYLVSGDRGSLAVPTLRLQTARGHEASWFEPMREARLSAPASDPLQRQLEHFAAVVRREEAPLVSVRDATRSLQITLAIAESAASGCLVRCDKITG
jgi:predicted dehydrogenase